MRASKIFLPEDRHDIQLNLFAPTSVTPIGNLDPFPDFLGTRTGMERIVDRATVEDGLGIDFEFKNYHKPSIIGLANTDLMGAISCDKKLAENAINWCISAGIPLVGHSFIGAERRVVKEWLGIDIPVELIEDSMLRHYLLNQDFNKGTSKEDDEGSLGFMNLYCAASMVLDVYQWKICRGRACEGPCPSHDVWGYCAADSFCSVAANKIQKQQMKEEGVPEQFYRELVELSVICDEMEQNGLRIDIPYIEKINKEMEEEKDKIFSYEVFGKNKVYKEFNPRSSDQICEFFKDTNIPLKSADIKYISKVLEKEGNKAGYGELQDYVEYLDGGGDKLVTPMRELFKLYRYKSEGKGLDSWFAEKYRTKDFIHPRQITTGTSSGRLSSSRPNGANIPQRGWAVVEDAEGNEFNRIKACIIPRDSSLEFAEGDYCLDGKTKVLGIDLLWRNIEDFKVGDELIGFDEDLGINNKYRRSKVISSKKVLRHSYKITTDFGEVIASAEHKWVVRRKKKKGGGKVRQWVETQDLKIGEKIAFFKKPWYTDNSYESGYIAGFVDGEGWCTKTHVGFAQNPGSCLTNVLELINKKGFDTGLAGIGKKGCHKYIIRGDKDSLRFMGSFRPKRLLEKSSVVWENKRTWSNYSTSAEITNIEYLGEKEVIALGTTTKTLIANGFFSHNCQMEFRGVLWFAGIDPEDAGEDAYTWLVNKDYESFRKAAASWPGLNPDKPKDVRYGAKTMGLAANYCESLEIFYADDMMKPAFKRQVANGAIRLYKDWEYCGGIVGFTGSNLAQRFFGSKSDENRKRALGIMEDIYFKTFPQIRSWQKKVLQEIEDTGKITSPTGRFLRLYGTPRDNAKVGVAFLGQGCTGADHAQAVILKYKRELGVVPDLVVHDSMLLSFDRNWSDKKVNDLFQLMREETWRLPGFKCPVDIKRGLNYGKMRKLKV